MCLDGRKVSVSRMLSADESMCLDEQSEELLHSTDFFILISIILSFIKPVLFGSLYFGKFAAKEAVRDGRFQQQA